MWTRTLIYTNQDRNRTVLCLIGASYSQQTCSSVLTSFKFICPKIFNVSLNTVRICLPSIWQGNLNQQEERGALYYLNLSQFYYYQDYIIMLYVCTQLAKALISWRMGYFWLYVHLKKDTSVGVCPTCCMNFGLQRKHCIRFGLEGKQCIRFGLQPKHCNQNIVFVQYVFRNWFHTFRENSVRIWLGKACLKLMLICFVRLTGIVCRIPMVVNGGVFNTTAG